MFSIRNSVLISFLIIILSLLWNRVPRHCEDHDHISSLLKESQMFIMNGIPGKVEPSDPLHVDEVSSDNGVLNFKLKNITMHGLRDCSTELLKIDPEHLVFIYRFDCASLFMTKEFDVKGFIQSYAIEDQGHGNVTMIDYSFLLYGELSELYYDGYGKLHYQIKSFDVKIKIRGHTDIKNESYIAGNFEKYKKAYEFVEEDSKDAQNIFRPILMKSLMKKYVHNINSYMKERSVY